MVKNILVLVRSEQKGLYAGIGKRLSMDYEVQFCVDNAFVESAIKKILPDSQIPIQILPEIRLNPEPNSDTVKNAVGLEKKYGQTMSFLLSGDRNLGRGYLTNIDRYVSTKRMYWSHRMRMQFLVNEIEKYEQVLCGYDVLICQYPESVPVMVCEHFGIHHYHLLPAKFGDRCFWSNDGYIRSDKYDRMLEECIRQAIPGSDRQVPNYRVDAGGDKVNLGVEYSLRVAISQSVKIIYQESLNYFLKRRKPNSVKLYGWVPGRFRKVRNYNYTKKYGVTPQVVADYHLAYFPLHMEPEVTLLQFSPEFVNTFEAIIWIAKSLPADWLLVVKEQANAYQFRSREFYDRLRQIGNVVIATPEIHSWNWIKQSKFVATITGTVSFESVYFKRPVLTYGRHQIVNQLPTVFSVSNYEDTKAVVHRIVSGAVSENDLALSSVALYEAQSSISFELDSFKDSYKTGLVDQNDVERACTELLTRFPEVFSQTSANSQ